MRQSEPSPGRRVLAIGDLHADAPPFLRFLLVHRLLGQDADTGQAVWTGGDTVLVQTGDVPDRGPDTVALCHLLTALRQSGGTLYTLLGNHDVPYLLTDDAAEQMKRLRQALPYMFDAELRGSEAMPSAMAEYQRQAQAVTALHQHPDGGLVALKLGATLFLHGEPNPASLDETDLAELAAGGRVRFDPARHPLEHRAFWGRAYSCGTSDFEGGYLPSRRRSIRPARDYDPKILAQHEAEPRVAALYERLTALGVERIAHGHVPGPTVRDYRVCGLEHVNLDEAINLHYRLLYTGARDDAFVPRGWQTALADGVG